MGGVVGRLISKDKSRYLLVSYTLILWRGGRGLTLVREKSRNVTDC